jgi:hypothetical protein
MSEWWGTKLGDTSEWWGTRVGDGGIEFCDGMGTEMGLACNEGVWMVQNYQISLCCVTCNWVCM